MLLTEKVDHQLSYHSHLSNIPKRNDLQTEECSIGLRIGNDGLLPHQIRQCSVEVKRPL